MSNRQDWEREEVFVLIEGWEAHHESLEKMSKKQPYFENFCNMLKERGFDRTIDQIQRKISWLRIDYVKKKPGVTGSSPSTWPYYNAVHKILHENHYCNIDNVKTMESGLPSRTILETERGDEEENGEQNVVLSDDEPTTPGASQSTNVEPDVVGSSSQCLVNERVASLSGRAARSCKRKLNQRDKLQQDTYQLLKECQNEESEFMKNSQQTQQQNSQLLAQIAGHFGAMVELMKTQQNNTMNYNVSPPPPQSWFTNSYGGGGWSMSSGNLSNPPFTCSPSTSPGRVSGVPWRMPTTWPNKSFTGASEQDSPNDLTKL